MPAREKSRAAGVVSAGSASWDQARNSAGGPSKATAAGVHRDHPVAGREAALEAVFGEQHRHPPLLVEAAQQPDQLVAGDRVELGGRLVEQDQAGTGDQGRREGDALQLTAGERVDAAFEQVRDRQGEGHLLDRPGAVAGGVAAHLQRQLDLGGDGGRDDLGLGVLGDVADEGRQLRRTGLDRVEAGDVDRAGDLAAVEVRDEPAGRFQEGRLARGRAPGEQRELARSDLQRDAGERRANRVRVGVARAPRSPAPERRRGESPAQTRDGSRAGAAPGPRRSTGCGRASAASRRRRDRPRNGARPLSTSSAASASVAGCSPAWIVG